MTAKPQWTPIEETHLVVPSTENIRNLFEAAYPDRGKEFDRWYNAEIAEAERRGARKALQDFKKFTMRIMPSKVLRADVIADLEESLKRLSKDSYLIMGPLRADLLEGDHDDR